MMQLIEIKDINSQLVSSVFLAVALTHSERKISLEVFLNCVT